MNAMQPLTPSGGQPPGAMSSGAPPGAPPGASFHGALEGEMARTALAEGQHGRSAEGGSAERQSPRRHTVDDAAQQQSGSLAAASGSAPARATQEARDGGSPQAAGNASAAGSATADGSPATGSASASGSPTASPPASASPTPAATASAPAAGSPDAPGAASAQAATVPGVTGRDDASAGSSEVPLPAAGGSSPVLERQAPRGAEGLPVAGPDPGGLQQPSAGASPPIATLGQAPKPQQPLSGQQDGAGTGIAVAGSEPKASQPTDLMHGAQPVEGPDGPSSPAPAEAQVAVPGPAKGPLGGSADPGIRAQGGVVKGAPAVTGEASPDGSASPAVAQAAASPANGAGPAASTTPGQAHHAAGAIEAAPAGSGAAPQGADGAASGQTAVAADSVQGLPPSVQGSARAPVLAAGVGMQEMIESVRATIDLAARRGISQARIALQPEELGEIRVHLSQGAEGLIARVTAGSEAAAQALASGRAELHHSLSTIGTSLLRLEIGSFNQHGEGRERTAGEAPGSGPAPSRGGSAAANENEQDAAQPVSAASAPRGALVDILA